MQVVLGGCRVLHMVQPAAWAKLVMLLQCMERFDVVVWVDVDALIVRPTLPVAELLLKGTCTGKHVAVSGNTCDSWPGINTGLMAWRSTEESRRIATELLRLSRAKVIRNNPWWEQHAMRMFLSKGGGFKHRTVCVASPKLQWFPESAQLGCMQNRDTAFMVHYPGAIKQDPVFIDHFLATGPANVTGGRSPP
jgi:hypothetical protein